MGVCRLPDVRLNHGLVKVKADYSSKNAHNNIFRGERVGLYAKMIDRDDHRVHALAVLNLRTPRFLRSTQLLTVEHVDQDVPSSPPAARGTR